MSFAYEIGDLTCLETNGNIYQVVKRVKEVPDADEHNRGDHYFVRKITTKKTEFKPGPAVFCHESWLCEHQKTLNAFKAVMTDEMKAYIDNVVFEPAFYYAYFAVQPYMTAHFIVKKEDFEKVNTAFSEIPFVPDIMERGKALLAKLLEEGILKITNILTVKKSDLQKDEIVCLIEIGRYEDDFAEEDLYTHKVYRSFRVKKIRIKQP